MTDNLFQLHLHTSESSACSQCSGSLMARACKYAGYSTIVITDHFINANTTAHPRDPWPKQVETLMRGFRNAKETGDRIGLCVLFGWETFNDGPEYLTYGLGETFLLDNPDIASLSSEEYLLRVEQAGGFVCHAHPYRVAPYIPPFTPAHTHLEAFEVFNANNHPAQNPPALLEARRHNLIELAGADAHTPYHVRAGAMRSPWPIYDSPSLIEALRSRRCEIIESF